ncbi:hypothetical protein HPB48_014072 [Haemaphysalis longicornis]|uniref:tRNA (guanine(26)-N(2))-dimethyltransferase n=1 Tax=Haemaphysalis longicornis TaxID=44386 RepID=A0A9J6FPY0_HAELO|nr:hypothetical protein HPB48_014072 [Haemaphysalis longicornis]
MKVNIDHNHVGHIVFPNRGEASLLMHMHKIDRFDVIDLDPYGSPAPFLDSAVQAVKDKGLLLVTCTDMAILCGNSSETCRAKYGAVSLKAKCCHEMALRIVLQSIESHANRYGRYTIPLLALSVDFYVRVFVRVYTGPAIVKRSTSKLGMVYQCSGCETFTLQPLGRCAEKGNSFKFTPALGPPVGLNCTHCGHKHHIGGPMWIDPLHNVDFVGRLIQRVSREPRAVRHLQTDAGHPAHAGRGVGGSPVLHAGQAGINCSRLNAKHASVQLLRQRRSALLNAGHQVSLSHACKNSVKTDAPMEFIWDIIRTWKLQNPSKKPLEPGSPGEGIMKTEPTSPVSFAIHPGANPSSREQQLLRYQVNPEPCWGPKTRAKTSLWADREVEKRQRLQGKRKLRTSQGSGDLPEAKRPPDLADDDCRPADDATQQEALKGEEGEKQDASKG